MDEIVNKVAEKTGVGADTVRAVSSSALDVIKQKLPPQFAAQVGLFVKGAGGTGGRG